MNLESPWAPTTSPPPARLRHVLLELAAVVHDAQLRARADAVAHRALHVSHAVERVDGVDVRVAEDVQLRIRLAQLRVDVRASAADRSTFST